MTVYETKIVDDTDGTNPVYGDGVTITHTVTGLSDAAPDDVVAKAWLTIKSSLSDLDAAAVLQLEITTAATSAGQITDDGTGGTSATLKFTVSEAAQYTDITADISYHYDIQVLLVGATLPYTTERGRILWEAEVTQATS